MVNFQPAVLICLFAVSMFAMSNGLGERYMDRRRGHPFRQPLSSHFRQRIGSRNQYNNYNQYNNQSPNSPSDNPQREAPTSYPAAPVSSSAYYGGKVEKRPTEQRGLNSHRPAGYDSRGGDYDGGLNPLAALVAPLAALALLGAAAAVSTSPVLLTLAVLSSGRKRRDLEEVTGGNLTPELQEKLREMEVLEKYISKVPDQEQQQEKLMATYLSCSGYTEEQNSCMDRVVCEYSLVNGKMAALEKDVVSIVLYNIMSNSYVSKEFKDRLRTAAQYGRNRGQCSAFNCSALSKKQL